jgi:glucose/arabinose dehydrogenase
MRIRSTMTALALLAVVVPGTSAQSKDLPPQIGRGVTVPAGFVARVFAQLPDGQLPTALAWAQDPTFSSAAALSRGALHGTTLYVTSVSGNIFGAGNGKVYGYTDEGVPRLVADGLDAPLGVVMGPDQRTLYVSENDQAAGRGRITALTDADGDGVFETKRTVIKNLPNGRHQTNDLTFGPDGMLYITNGNATDNGLECGPRPLPLDCEHPERQPWSGSILRVDPAWADVDLLTDIRTDDGPCLAEDGRDLESVLVSWGFRNIYDVAFDPRRPGTVWTPMNGSDNPSSSEPLYAIDTTNQQLCGFEEDEEGNKIPIFGPLIEDAGFPSCLYDPHWNDFPVPQPLGGHTHEGIPDPQNNPHTGVQAAYGTCDAKIDSVHRPETIFEHGHEGTSGLAFETGGNFPDRYRNDLFVAEWGSLWNLNGLDVTGHKVIHIDLDADRKVVRQREFMTGVLPIDVSFGLNGRMYVADMSGQIYEVQHVVPTADVVRVDITSDGLFVPPVVTVLSGQTVRWVNLDDVAHNVQATRKTKPKDPRYGSFSPFGPGSEMNSPGTIAPGGSHSYTFWSGPAVYEYNSMDSTTTSGAVIVLPMER